MRLFPLSKNAIALSFVAVIVVGFFFSGLLNVLDFFIVKALLFSGFGVLLIIAIGYAFKNDNKKNHPEDKPQGDYQHFK